MMRGCMRGDGHDRGWDGGRWAASRALVMTAAGGGWGGGWVRERTRPRAVELHSLSHLQGPPSFWRMHQKKNRGER